MSTAQEDLSTADYTVVISDLHLCEAEPVHPKFPLWKKYKTKEFFFDETFSSFLNHLEKRAKGEKVELILNGDIFDFDSVTSQPLSPTYKITWLEKLRGLHPQEEKSLFKIQKILEDHKVWIESLSNFIKSGHRVIFIIGNHDLELHFELVQKHILHQLNLNEKEERRVRFCEWFYISNKDTLIEHGHHYDPYCVAQNPIYPFVQKFKRREIRLPFGNLATRYMINGMGYFNPHVDSNFILTGVEYLKVFFKYMIRSQPLLVWTWFWGAFVTLLQTFSDRLLPSLKDPLSEEEISEDIANKANATPGMVRQLRSLSVPSAAGSPWLLAKELWLDRAFILIIAAFVILKTYFFIDDFYPIAIWWVLIPLLIFLPPFVFYAQLTASNVIEYKEPSERIIMHSSWLTNTQRVVYGHTHLARHEIISGIEHLNSGCWSPSFLDIECTNSIDQKTYVWISPADDNKRIGELWRFDGKQSIPMFAHYEKKNGA